MTITKGENGKPLRTISNKDLVQLDALGFASSKADSGKFAVIGYFHHEPVAVFSFRETKDAIEFANMMLEKTMG